MRLLLALLVTLLALSLAAPTALATVRNCNAVDAHVWVDTGCYWYGGSNCTLYVKYDWCQGCSYGWAGFVPTLAYFVSCLPP